MSTAFRERRKNGKIQSKFWRREAESNRRIAALQAAALPLGHRALEKSVPVPIPKNCTQIARTTPIYVDCFPSKPLKTMSRGVFRKVLQTFALPLGDRAPGSGKNQAHKLWHSRSDSFRAKS